MPEIVAFFKSEMAKFASEPDARDRFRTEITLNRQWRGLSLDVRDDIRWHFVDMVKEARKAKRTLPAKQYAEMGAGRCLY